MLIQFNMKEQITQQKIDQKEQIRNIQKENPKWPQPYENMFNFTRIRKTEA